MNNQSAQGQPFFSIIIPAYNVENYIEESILSVLNQSFQNFELIIVNDGSIDNTAAIIKEYKEKNSNIIVINHSNNESLHISRIDGINIANGRYVIFLDSDDYFVDGAFDFLFNVIKNNPEFDFYEFAYIQQPSKILVPPWFLSDNRFLAYFSSENLSPSTMWNKVYKSTFIKKCFSHLERIYLNNTEDTYESVIIAYFVKNIYKIEEPIINYRIGTGMSTTYRDYSKTIILLESIKTLDILLNTFLKKMNQNINVDNLNYAFLKYTFNYYILCQKNRKERIDLFLIMKNYFKIEIILNFFSNREESWIGIIDKKKKELLNTKDYRIGYRILFPLRKVKKYLGILKDKFFR